MGDPHNFHGGLGVGVWNHHLHASSLALCTTYLAASSNILALIDALSSFCNKKWVSSAYAKQETLMVFTDHPDSSLEQLSCMLAVARKHQSPFFGLVIAVYFITIKFKFREGREFPHPCVLITINTSIFVRCMFIRHKRTINTYKHTTDHRPINIQLTHVRLYRVLFSFDCMFIRHKRTINP